MKHFRQFFVERKTIFDWLIFPPEGEHLDIANKIAAMEGDDSMVYRGINKAEYDALMRDGFVTSKGDGNTRLGLKASYLADDLQLGGRFALRHYMDGEGGYLLTIDKSKLPDQTQADPGNSYTSRIPKEAIVDIVDLGTLV